MNDWEKLLLLVMENDNTSASSSGLKLRADNRQKMRAIIQSVLDMDDDEAETFYAANKGDNQ